MKLSDIPEYLERCESTHDIESRNVHCIGWLGHPRQHTAVVGTPKRSLHWSNEDGS